LAAGVLAAWLLSRRITDPLAEMTRAAEGIAGGDYTRRVSDARDDELGRLAAAFNSMALQVEEAAKSLETRVADRTRELEEALRELRGAQVELVRRERLAGEARYRRLVETAHEGVWTIDKDLRTDYVNPRMAEMLGYLPEEMIGRSLIDFTDEDEIDSVEEHMQRRRQGVAEAYEVALRRKDGTKVWTFISASPILDESGAYAGSLGMVTDMTEHRKLEAQVRQTQKMDAVGQLAGGVAHDFNNLLTVIKGFTGFLLEDLADGDARRDDVKEIDQAATRAAALTRQLLAFSRRQVLEPRVLDLNGLVTEFEKMLRRLIPADVAIRTKLVPELGLVEADPGQLEQVLMNLAVNARDAMPDGGTLTIETENAELDRTYDSGHSPATIVPGPYVLLLVSDTGCGMDKATQARIFEPFFTTKEKGKGTGLGLSTVYGIVKQSGGYVWVYSEPGRGTTFKVYLPRVQAESGVSVRGAAGNPARRGSETILLVEDDDAVRAMARRILRRDGYRVLEATTGAAALRICAETGEAIDLILSDLVMPEMGGRELASRVRAQHSGARLLFMSGYTEEAAMQRSVLDSSEAFLSKPFTPEALTRKVREVLDRAAGVGAPAGGYQAGPNGARRS
ncbi:MAG: PAS domain S-box protein, partial [Gemmatimonadota bacterium]|nr:PAS domain S-box protein [Gemmatimonadota bacterium]